MQGERKKLILIGAGSRGKTYTDNAKLLEDKYEVVAVAEPVEDRRNYIRKAHNLRDDLCFDTWEPLLSMPKMADAAIIATMDRDHLAPTLEAIRKGYDILLEKPVCPTPEECYIIEREAEKYGVRILVCHVLRYTTFFRAIKKLIDNGTLGKVINVQHREDVGHVHQSHSFVRGNWGNEERSSCMILQKCCHDMDILQWLVGKKCKKVQSFGSLSYFTRDNAPEGAPERCIDGCPHGDNCPYNSVKLYLESDSKWFRRASTQLIDPTDADVERALRETQYGKCVYKCDNNVVDHQVVSMQMSDEVMGATNELRDFMFARVYDYAHVIIQEKAERMLTKLYEYFMKHTDKLPQAYHRLLDRDGKERVVCDYLSGMTDRYAINVFEDLFIPSSFSLGGILT